MTIPAWLSPFRFVRDHIPLAAAVFGSGQYWLNGADVPVSDLFLSNPVNGQGVFNPSAISSAGMALSSTNTPRFSAVLLAAAQGHKTLVFHYSTSADATLFSMHDTVDPNNANDKINSFDQATDVFSSGYSSLDLSSGLNACDAPPSRTAPNRFAITIGRDAGGGVYQYAACLNGRECQLKDHIAPAEWDIGFLGSDGFAAYEFTLHGFAVYGGVPDLDLIAMTHIMPRPEKN